MRHPLIIIGKFVAAIVVLSACEPAPDAEQPLQRLDSPASPVIYAVNYPLAYMAARIAGDAATVELPVPAGLDPAYWRPDAETIGRYQQADLILLNGAGYAAWVQRATLPPGRLVNTSAAVADRYISIDQAVTHGHGPEGDHNHSELAFTTWLDTEIAAAQARAILHSLIELRPEQEAEFRAAYELLVLDLRALDGSLEQAFDDLADGPFIVSHPVYQYLQRRYDLDAVSVHWEPDRIPDEAQWAELERILQGHRARVMIWEAEPLDQVRDRLGALGVEIAVFETAGNRPDRGDFMDAMRRNQLALTSAARYLSQGIGGD
ncbi:MAG: metal ABC transporter substrate-binding protein [Gammaproteobacteria bacterium]